MIDINQIRQGNIIKYAANDYWAKFIQGCEVVVDMDIYLDIDKQPGCFDPIELSPEWMEKFGFETPDGYNTSVLYNEIMIDLHMGKYKLRDKPKAKLDYVHQLQNIFYCLTGEELTIESFNQSN